jgi:hypothetical protein
MCMSVFSERRSSKRYSIERQLNYRVRGVRPPITGHGTTVNMSSNGVLFRSEQPLVLGKPVIVEIAWPVLLNDTRPLKLVARGHIVWTELELAAMNIEGWEFRTLGATAA